MPDLSDLEFDGIVEVPRQSVQALESCHMHAALEEGDLAEFKQCLAVLRPLHSRGVSLHAFNLCPACKFLCPKLSC